jgi:hypothetical protein
MVLQADANKVTIVDARAKKRIRFEEVFMV